MTTDTPTLSPKNIIELDTLQAFGDYFESEFSIQQQGHKKHGWLVKFTPLDNLEISNGKKKKKYKKQCVNALSEAIKEITGKDVIVSKKQKHVTISNVDAENIVNQTVENAEDISLVDQIYNQYEQKIRLLIS